MKQESPVLKNRMTIEELREYYTANFPYIANDQRIGRFAKKEGYVPVRQMVNRQWVRYYIRNTPND